MALVCLHCGRLFRDLEMAREGVRGKMTYPGAPDNLADIDRFSVSEMPPPILEESFSYSYPFVVLLFLLSVPLNPSKKFFEDRMLFTRNLLGGACS
jgi:hypothetical protein